MNRSLGNILPSRPTGLSKKLKPNHDHRFIRSRLSSNSYIQRVIALLDSTQRSDVLATIEESTYQDEIVTMPIGEDTHLFRLALTRGASREMALASLGLQKLPTPSWFERAEVALNAGISPQKIFESTIPSSWGWTGLQSKYFEECRQKYATLLVHSDPRLKSVGQLGDSHYSNERAKALKRERDAAVKGLIR